MTWMKKVKVYDILTVHFYLDTNVYYISRLYKLILAIM